jgi:hypothetical protein
MKKFRYLFSCALCFLLLSCGSENQEEEEIVQEVVIPEPTIEYGFNLDSFTVIHDTVLPGWTMSHMFQGYGLTQYQINIAADLAADSLVGLKYIKEGTGYMMLTDPNDTSDNSRKKRKGSTDNGENAFG